MLSTSGSPVNTTVLSFRGRKGTTQLEILSSVFRRSRVPMARLFEDIPRVPILRRGTLRLTGNQILSVKTKDNYRALTLRRGKLRIGTVSVSPLDYRTVGLEKIGSTRYVGLFSPRLDDKGRSKRGLRRFRNNFSAVLLLVGKAKVTKGVRRLPTLFRHLGTLLGPNNRVLVSSSSLGCVCRGRSKDFSVGLGKTCCKRMSCRVVCGSMGNSHFS